VTAPSDVELFSTFEAGPTGIIALKRR